MDYIALGLRIRNARRHLNMTQQQLAEKVDVSTSFIGHIERGTRALSLQTFVQLCVVLKASPAHLLGLSHPDFPELTALPPPQQEQLAQLIDYACAVIKTSVSC